MMTSQKAKMIYDNLANVIKDRNERGIYTAMGFSSDLDLIADFQIETMNGLLNQYLPDGILWEMKPSVMIRTMEELLETLVYFCIRGIGGEANIEDPDLVRDHFSCKNAMGGAAVQAALAMNSLGAGSIVHLTDDSKEVRDLLVSPHVRVPLPDGSLGGTDEVKEVHEQEVHVIVQFRKGSRICLKDQEVTIPRSNRLIITQYTVNNTLPLNEDYLHWVEQNAHKVSSNMLSSFNCILDTTVLPARMKRVQKHVEIYHKNNPDGVVYFEDGHYHDKAVKQTVMESLYPLVDIMSMNEDELAYTMNIYGRSVQIDDIFSCAEGLAFLRDLFKIRRGVIVHTKDYAMFFGDSGGLEIEKGMVYGTLMATARAEFGVYGSDREIRETLKHPLNETGVRNMERIAASALKDQVVIVPTFYLDHANYTIGLGDSFTGGMQLCF